MIEPYYQDNHIKIFNKDCRELAELPDNSVQMVVTSPPYWGLRKYSGEQELIWGDNHCGHQWGDIIPNPMVKSGKHGPASILTKTADEQHAVRKESNQGSFCSLCGAWKGAYGLEPTPEMYIEHTIEILREIRRVLRKDGVVFWNVGDSYMGSGQSRGKYHETGLIRSEDNRSSIKEKPVTQMHHDILKPKDLCLIPFRLAIAAQEDGWWVRSVIIWSKPNPMPESVTDRPTESHEYILLLTKSARYYWDADAVREKGVYPEGELRQGGNHKSLDSGSRTTAGLHTKDWIGDGGRNIRSVWEFPEEPKVRGLKTKGEQGLKGQEQHHGQDIFPQSGSRNLRSVWNFPTQPYPEAHFAVFPEKLPEICIKASTPEVGCCSKCGAPWERITEKIPQNVRSHKLVRGKVKDAVDGNNPDMAVGGGFSRTGVQFEWEVKTLGWQPTCECNADKVPSIVLDPFMGAGTTLWVAKKLNRQAIGYEISEEYCQLALERNRQQALNLGDLTK